MQKLSITNLKKINKTEVFVEFDNGNGTNLNNDLVFKYGLTVSKAIDFDAYQSVIREQSLISAKQIAYKFATYKPRTEYEVYLKLEKEFRDDVIKKAIIFLQKHNILDDDNYIKMYCKEKFNLKGWSYFRLRSELQKRGIDKQSFHNNYRTLFSDNEVLQKGEQIAQKKMKTIKDSNPYIVRSKLKNHLIRYGYNENFITQILDALLKSDQ
jgi:regulatory protein